MAPRYHIDTIPVWDALKKQDECMLCVLRRRTEHLLADRFLGGSVMEPQTRIRVNEKGFCPVHHKMLFDRENKLGHALMMLSHIKEVQCKIEKLHLLKSDKIENGIFNFKHIINKKSSNLNNLIYGCILCDQLDENIKRYAYTIIHLWENDKAFQKEFLLSKGLCLPDTDLLLQFSEEHLSGRSLLSFKNALENLLSESLSRLEDELEWFTLKFDYRNSDKPWETSKDALERSITKLRGWSVGKDPGKEY